MSTPDNIIVNCGSVMQPLGVGNYCYVAVCSTALGASAPTEGGEGRGHIVADARLQLAIIIIIITGRMPRQTAGINYSQAKNQVFRPAGATRCTDSCQTWHGLRVPGSAWLSKISPQSAKGVGMRPQNIMNFHFLVKSRPTGANP